LLDAALSPETRAVYEANTTEAIRRSVFGSPTYFVHGDMFYGQDRLELVERTLKQPFDGAWLLERKASVRHGTLKRNPDKKPQN